MVVEEEVEEVAEEVVIVRMIASQAQGTFLAEAVKNFHPRLA